MHYCRDMTTTYFRIHPAGESPETVLSPARWSSCVWIGESEKHCPACHGSGDDLTSDDGAPCEHCEGSGVVEDVRHGVSVCRSLDDLRAYFADRCANLDGCTVIELEGDISADDDHDAAAGALLVIPNRIVRTIPATEI